MIPQRIEPVFTERYETGESVLSAQVNSVKGVYIKKLSLFYCCLNPVSRPPDCAPDLPSRITAGVQNGRSGRYQIGQGRGSGDQTLGRRSRPGQFEDADSPDQGPGSL